MTRTQKAFDNFNKGYNCCQSIVIAFADELGLDEKTAALLSSGFGGGFGRLGEVCGAVSGMVFVISALKGYSVPTSGDDKKELYALVQRLLGEFQKENQSIICRELISLQQANKDAFSCAELVKNAAKILEKEFF